jgi:phage terminase large subunit GpA-like protein
MTPASQLQSIFQNAVRAAIPDTNLTVAQWADTYRYVSQGPLAGTKWKTARVPFFKEILECVTDLRVQEIVLWSSSRVGKTEALLNNVVGYFMHIDPCPIMMVQPTLEMAEKYSRDRLTPMIRETPVLRELVDDPRTRDSGNTILYKEFRGGHISIVGANSPAGLRAEDIRVLLLDEVSAYPVSAGNQGDPVRLARVRTRNFRALGDALVIQTSSPTTKGICRIEKAYQLSDQRELWIQCSGCGEWQLPAWRNIHWSDLELKPHQACYVCEICGEMIEGDDKDEMFRRYEWRARVPFNEHSGVVGFKLTGLASTFISLGDMAEEITEAKRAQSNEMIQVWVNTTLGELWEPEEWIDAEELNFSTEEYRAPVPAGVLLLTFGVDVQLDRVEIEITGWSHGDERWLIAYRVIYGNPREYPGDIWTELADFLHAEFKHESGVMMSCTAGGIDSHYATDSVYQFCKANWRHRWFACQGSSKPGKPIAPRKPSEAGRMKVKLFTVGTESAKDKIFASLRVSNARPEGARPGGPGYYHLPDWINRDYLQQLCSEKAVMTISRGYQVRVYRPIKAGIRNEPLDCAVYSTFAKEMINPNYERLEARLLERIAAAKEESETPAPAAREPEPPAATRPEKFRRPWRRDLEKYKRRTW